MMCCSIQALLSAPNPDDPLAEEVAKHWKDNEVEALATGAPRPFSFSPILYILEWWWIAGAYNR